MVGPFELVEQPTNCKQEHVPVPQTAEPQLEKPTGRNKENRQSVVIAGLSSTDLKAMQRKREEKLRAMGFKR